MPTTNIIIRMSLFSILSVAICSVVMVRQSAASPGGAEVLARGPVHEAFAEPLNLHGIDPQMVSTAPPKPVEELPPEVKPDGNNVQWIPGYWAWEVDRKDYVWISGVWRDCPPRQIWVPGHWNESDSGWCWSAGLWISETVNEVEYLPQPPETLEEGPTIQPPTENHIWVPGVWRYVESRYAWQPGYWTGAQPDWLWTPAHYIWSPSGYVFVDGFWDYPLERRGVLFAPVYYKQPTYLQANYHYTPSAVISTDLLTAHLFARPRYGQYYFGDYYAPRYREIGIEPWLMVPRTRGCYDPLFTYYDRSYRREGRDWNRTVRDRYDFFDRHRDYRPAHTLADLRRQRFEPIRTGDTNIQNIVSQQNTLVLNYNQFVQNEQRNVQGGGDRSRGLRFATLGEDDRRVFAAQAKAYRGFQQRRTETETVARRGRTSDRGAVADSNPRPARTLSLTDLRNSTTKQRRREQGPRTATELPPTPDQGTRRNTAPRVIPNNSAKSVPEVAPGASQNTERGRLRDATQERGGSGPRPSVGPTASAKSHAKTGPANDRGNDRSNRSNSRSELEADNNAINRTSPSTESGPSLNSPKQVPITGQRPSQIDPARQRNSERSRSSLGTSPQSRRNEVDRATNAGDQTDRRRTSNYRPTIRENSVAPNRAPAAGDKLPSVDKSNGQSREKASRGTPDDPSRRDRGIDAAYPGLSGRQSAAPAPDRGAKETRDTGTRDARRLNVPQQPNSKAAGQVPPQRDSRIRGSGQSAPPQFGNDTSNRSLRDQTGGRNSSAPKKDSHGSDRATLPSARSTRDNARAVAPKSAPSKKGVTQGSRDTRPQSRSESPSSDKPNKRKDKEEGAR